MKKVFKASDGSEHASEEFALQRERLLITAATLKEATEAIAQLIGANGKTADGLRFDTTAFRDYWLVRERWGQAPIITRINLYPHNLSIDLDRADGALVVREFVAGPRGGGEYVTYRVNELYASEKAAKKEVLRLYKAACARMAHEIAEMEQD